MPESVFLTAEDGHGESYLLADPAQLEGESLILSDPATGRPCLLVNKAKFMASGYRVTIAEARS